MPSFPHKGQWFPQSRQGMIKNTGTHSVRTGRFLGFDLFRFLALQDPGYVGNSYKYVAFFLFFPSVFLSQMHALVLKGPCSTPRIFKAVYGNILGIYDLILPMALF